MNEVKLVNEYGEPVTTAELLSKEFLMALPDQQLEELAYTVKELKKPLKNVEDQVKDRLKEGHEFSHIKLTTSGRTAIDQSEATKKALVNKYGWNAIEAKSPTQLKKIFGEAIEPDLGKVVVHSTIDRVKYD